ncbi:Imm50 family immunity protein [Bacillus paralicheniformis]|uniref:Imm50 family immunity protein n=1 Tax=Bacillus paralicheniformis TaxID=1648923 RepID=UPI00228306DA|nr:Imm50 family immunity protein [Bacillus paralicheniformis]MCY8149963.1 immunity 50 family protein [Bacillus paralicheniformis]MCY9420375.1 immunity 50 family protein [Bacillus paralicheniformis]MEC0578457.1 Imm50 family immunity protein [Bacillus paralicheniformis]
MWYENLEENYFLKSLYNEIPKLENIRIEGIYIKEKGRKATLHFDMPFYAEKPLKKWANLGYNSIALEVDIFNIHSLEMKTLSDTYRGNIEINKDDQGLIEINITGEITAKIKADAGLIQSINGYINGALEKE